MNTNEAVKELLHGKKLHSIYDSKDIYYIGYSNGRIARLHADSLCSSRLINVWDENDFLKDHMSINFELYNSIEI
jgi:hypothetical protein